MVKFTPSAQQAAVLDWIVTGKGSARVGAVAGSGKTSTVVDGLFLMHGSWAYCVFNTKNAKEAQAKIAAIEVGDHKNGVPARTMKGKGRAGTFHSFGFGAVRRVYPDMKVSQNGEKDDRICSELMIPTRLRGFVTKLVSLAKNRAVGLLADPRNAQTWWDIVEHFDLAADLEDQGDLEPAIKLAERALHLSTQIAHEIIDFDDMIYLPVVTNMRVWQNDWVVVDEDQDTNACRRALARKMLRPGGRALFVGDRHQAIYGFTGADNDAVDQIIRDFNCAELDLSITFRCPKKVVALAQQYVKHIEAGETAPDGLVSHVNEDDVFSKVNFGPMDAILCRKTAPIVKKAFAIIKRGIACRVEGRDIGKGLIKMVNRYRSARTLTALMDRLEAWGEKRIQNLMAKKKESMAENLRDQIDTIAVIASQVRTIDELKAKIADMFEDTEGNPRKALTLSTVHKAKGREWGRVYLYGQNLWMPSRWARQQWQVDQEVNLIYVAYTRAMCELVLVDAKPE